MLTELSYVLGESIPKWPTNPSDRLEKVLCFENGDPNNAFSVYHHMHNGTHVDAPVHFSANGKNITELPIGDFYYTSPAVLRLKKDKGEVFTVEDLVSYEKEIAEADIIFIYTGYSDFRDKDPKAYVDGFPAFSKQAAEYLRDGFPKLKAIALDVISADQSTCVGFPAHKAFLHREKGDNTRTLLIFEDVNVKKIADLKEPIQAICAFPIRWEQAEAAPVAMVAIS